MKRTFLLLLTGIVLAVAMPTAAQGPPLLPEETVAALAEELSGELAKRNLELLAQYHRMRGSRQFRAAAEFIAARAREYGLAGVEILQFPADGKLFYGTQRSRPAWDAEFAELWEVREERGRRVRIERLASFDAMPVSLAQDSESAAVTAELVDCGEGTRETDYAGKDVRGKICLVAAQPGAAMPLAVERFGAAGLISYAQNQRQAWWGENRNLVRWGHLDSFTPTKTFAFMVSPGRAATLRERLARGEQIVLEANVNAGRRPGFYDVVTATIPGADVRREEEIVFSCHLDHQRPGANDNASGCATILEVGRTLAKLIREGRLPRPARTLRFIWPPEIEGTMALLNARPELAARFVAVVHMDMVGGGPETKAVFHVTRSPMSLPTFVNDVAEAFAEFVNEQSYQFATTGRAAYPLVAREGGKEPLAARLAPFSMGSDHQVYADSSWAIPAIYLNDWPDRYIHTNFDSPANIDPTKLLRAGFIGAASGYFLARFAPEDEAAVLAVLERGRLRRLAAALQMSAAVPPPEAEILKREAVRYEASLVMSLERFLPLTPQRAKALEQIPQLASLLGIAGEGAGAAGPGAFVFRRSGEKKGPMSVFGYDYFADHCAARNVCDPRLLRFQGLWGAGSEYAYEVLNFADGIRTAQQIRDAVSAAYGPVPLELVVEYLQALEAIGVVERVQ